MTAELSDSLRSRRAATIDRLGREATIWLAVAPLWTRDVAVAAGTARWAVAAGTPWPDITGFIEQAHAAGWCEIRGSLSDEEPGGVLFWMPDALRHDVLEILTGQEGPSLISKAVDIAERVLAAQELRSERADIGALPGALRRWAFLLTQPAPDQALVGSVRVAVDDGDLGGAQQLVAAGEALAPLLAGTAELALDRARRLMSLGVRRRNDRRTLVRYQDRPELTAAITALWRPDTEQWALHLRGAGGIGKTMLIRDLASGRFAVKHDISAFPVIRADFDHISPDYPTRRPVQLLVELADELALHAAAVTRADSALSYFRAAATSAHELLSSSREQAGPVLENELVRRAVDAFAQALESLSGVLIVLDTCEELAKADAGDPNAPAVTATFDIIERIREQSSSTRVLLAGRRPLPDRDYLTVTHVEGFTVDEARNYLAEFSNRELDPALAEAMIRQSAAVDADVPRRDALPGRVSPFDLALYLSWAEEDPGLSEQRVLAGSDAYVEGRIIDRLRDPLILEALAELAMIGRSRVDTLATFVTGGSESAGALGTRLAEQEWIDAAGDPPVYVTPKPVLGLRLRRYFSAPDRADRYRARIARLAGTLAQRISSTPLADIDVDELLAALRLAAPADAARLWDGIADRAMEPPGHWGWMLNVTRRVLGEAEDEQWPTEGALRATVLACHIAARRRAAVTFDPHPAWGDVRACADAHPDRGTATILRGRAALGMLPYQPADESLWTDVQQAPVSGLLAAAAVDSLERMLELGSLKAAARLNAESSQLHAAIDGQAGPHAQAWALVMRGRLAAEDPLAEAVMDPRVEDLAADPAEQPAWPDWVPPGDLLARVRIECGLLEPPDVTVLDRWETYAAGDLRLIDRDRLAALCLRIRLDRGTIDRAALDRWERLDNYVPSRGALCSAYDLIPPLCVLLAEAELVAGRPDHAVALLELRRGVVLGMRQEGGDDATIRALDEQTIRIVRRYRLDDHRPLLARLAGASYSSSPARLRLRDSACRAMALVHDERSATYGAEVTRRPAGWHTWWQCQDTLPEQAPSSRWPVPFPHSDLPADGDLAADIRLDIKEAGLIGGSELAAGLERQFASWLALPWRPVPPVRSHDRYREVRAGLRRAALGLGKFEPRPGTPVRLIAELAFEEAELVAPRLPIAAAWLFERAHEGFVQAGDRVGQLLAAAARAGILGDKDGLQAALSALETKNPAVADVLVGPVEQAGPWRYWAARIQQLTAPEPRKRLTYQAPVADSATTRQFIRPMLLTTLLGYLTAIAALLAGLVSADVISSHQAPLAGVQMVAGGVLVWLTVAALPAVRRELDGRGVGAFPLAMQRFHVAVSRDENQLADRVLFRTQMGLPANTFVYFRRGRRRLLTSVLWTSVLVFFLPYLGIGETLFRRLRPATGYTGTMPVGHEKGQQRLDWLGAPPAASARWWRDPVGPIWGRITLDGVDATLPWEQILTAGLGPDAASRVRWYRQVGGNVKPYPTRRATGIATDAPAAWLSSLATFYQSHRTAYEVTGRPLLVRHAVGRAVITSAGPRLDVSGDAAEAAGTSELLSAEVLTSGRPRLIILQAEPVAEVIDIRLIDDLREKLALAADLMEDGAPAVLILPALPARLLGTVAQTIVKEQDARRRGATYGPEQMQTKLRSAIAEAVASSVLDDIVLLMNARR